MNFRRNRGNLSLFFPGWKDRNSRAVRNTTAEKWICLFTVCLLFCLDLKATEIGETSGQAERYDSRLRSWQRVNQGSEIRFGERVRTGSGAFLELRFSGKRYIRLAERSEVELNGTEGGDSPRDIAISLTRGRIWASVLVRKIRRGSLKIRTPVALVAVRGTQLDASFRRDLGELQLAVLSGSVEVAPPEMVEGPEVAEGPREIEPPREITREEWMVLVGSGHLFSITAGGEPRILKAGETGLENGWVVANRQRDLQVMQE